MGITKVVVVGEKPQPRPPTTALNTRIYEIYKKSFRIILLLVLIVALYLIGVILYGTITEYKPDPETSEKVKTEGNALASNSIDSVINLMIWNIGYGGLGKEADFFTMAEEW